MTRCPATPPSAKLDVAAITFLVFNLLAAAVFALIVKDTLTTTGQHTAFLMEHIGKLAGSIYAIAIGCLVLLRRAPFLWISGGVVSILTGCALSRHLDGWFALPFLLPVSLWLIVASRRYRQALENQPAEFDDAASRARALAGALAGMLPAVLKFIGAYLLGIFSCVLLMAVMGAMPGELSQADFDDIAELGAWVGAPVPGLFFFFQIAWWAVLILLVLFIGFWRRPFFVSWRSVSLGFSIGFLGTLGSYWMALQSIP